MVQCNHLLLRKKWVIEGIRGKRSNENEKSWNENELAEGEGKRLAKFTGYWPEEGNFTPTAATLLLNWEDTQLKTAILHKCGKLHRHREGRYTWEWERNLEANSKRKRKRKCEFVESIKWLNEERKKMIADWREHLSFQQPWEFIPEQAERGFEKKFEKILGRLVVHVVACFEWNCYEWQNMTIWEQRGDKQK